MLFLFKKGSPTGKVYSGASLNSIRSSLSFFLQFDLPNLGSDPILKRLFRYFYLQRPNFPKYVVTWDVGKVLHFLADWHPASALSIKELTLKTVTLLALTSVDRAQTLHKLNVEHVSFAAHGLEFVVQDVLKTSRRGKPAKVVTCVSWDDERLDVCAYVLAYINKTFVFRHKAVRKGFSKPTQLFLSHRTGRPVRRATISSWIREVLSLAGVDVASFGPGTTRSASASNAARKGASAEQIMKAGCWTNLGTFQRFYERHVDDTPVGRLILQGSTVSIMPFVSLGFLVSLIGWYVRG